MLSDYKDAKLSGLPINPKDETRLYKAVKGTEFEAKFSVIKKQGESLGFITGSLASNPLTFGAARLGYEIAPLNLENPDGLSQQLQQRAAIGSKVRAVNNLSYTPVLTTDEAKGLADLLKRQQTGGVQTIQQFTRVIGKDGMTGIARQVAAEDTQTGMIIAFTAQGKAGIANTISEGNRYITEKTVKMPKEDELRGKYDLWVSNAFLGMPESSHAHYEAFKSFYASRAAKKGIADGTLDKDTAKEAINAVVGDVVKLNGKSIVIPDGYSEGQFKNSIKRIDAGVIKSMGGVYGLSDEDAAEVIRDDAQWFATSQDGTYRVVVNGKYMMTKNGRYVQFNFGDKPVFTPTPGVKKKKLIEGD